MTGPHAVGCRGQEPVRTCTARDEPFAEDLCEKSENGYEHA